MHWTTGTVLDHGRRIAAMRVVLPDHAVLRGWSAAWALAVTWAADDDPVEVVMPHGERTRRREFLTVSGESLATGEVIDLDGFGRCTTPARTAFDLARRLPLDRAVAAADALLRTTGTPVEDLQAVLDAHGGVRGRRRAALVVPLVDPRAESPRESMLRVALVEAGLPTPVPQHEVWAGREFVARLDLAWPDLKVAIEYDGAHHRERDQHSRDLARHNRLRTLGWTVFQVDADQLRSPGRLLAEVRVTLERRARAQSRSRR